MAIYHQGETWIFSIIKPKNKDRREDSQFSAFISSKYSAQTYSIYSTNRMMMTVSRIVVYKLYNRYDTYLQMRMYFQ